MKLIVGLGNPEKKYNKTRHNIGFYILDNYLKNPKWSKKFNAKYIETAINGEKVIFVKPETYMNLSGNAVKQFFDYYNIKAENILIIQDDLDMDFGKIRLKNDSSSGGHNGIESIINSLGTREFYRLKIGIGSHYNIEAANHVLGKFSRSEMQKINNDLSLYFTVIDEFIAK